MTEIRRLAKIPESTIKCVIKKIFDQCVVNLQISVKNQPTAVRPPHPSPGGRNIRHVRNGGAARSGASLTVPSPGLRACLRAP